MAMIEAAERDGQLRPGGTIVEPTSGNTGTGLAIAARLKGYRVIAVMPDKMSREKIDLLRAYGAEVVVAPTDVAADSPQSYYRVADRLTEEIPGAFQPNQYANPANPQAHYDSTGPELWASWDRLTHLVLGVGTGGTITGTARYLRERKPDLVVVGADPEGSIYSGGEEGMHPYLIEGVGEDFWPATFDRDHGRPLGHGVRPRRVPHHPAAGPDRGHPGRRLGRPGPARRAGGRRRARRPRGGRLRDHPRRRALLPEQDLLRRLDAPVRLPGARRRADRRRRAAAQARGRRDPVAGHRRAPLPGARRGRAAARAPRLAAAGRVRPRPVARSSARSASAGCCATPPRTRPCSTPRSWT